MLTTYPASSRPFRVDAPAAWGLSRPRSAEPEAAPPQTAVVRAPSVREFYLRTLWCALRPVADSQGPQLGLLSSFYELPPSETYNTIISDINILRILRYFETYTLKFVYFPFFLILISPFDVKSIMHELMIVLSKIISYKIEDLSALMVYWGLMHETEDVFDRFPLFFA